MNTRIIIYTGHREIGLVLGPDSQEKNVLKNVFKSSTTRKWRNGSTPCGGHLDT